MKRDVLRPAALVGTVVIMLINDVADAFSSHLFHERRWQLEVLRRRWN
jgi:hypothetical protein